MFCALSKGSTGLEQPTTWISDFADTAREDDDHWVTISFPDINGDGSVQGDCHPNASYALPWRTGGVSPRNKMRGG